MNRKTKLFINEDDLALKTKNVTWQKSFMPSTLSVNKLYKSQIFYWFLLAFCYFLYSFFLVHISISFSFLFLSLSISSLGSVEVWLLITIINYSLLFLLCVIFTHSSFFSSPLIRYGSISDAEGTWLHLNGLFWPW